MTQKDRLIIGITGASGVIYGIRFLQLLKNAPTETHLVLSKAAERTIAYETDFKIREIKEMADIVHDNADIGAPIASGSFRARGMVIAPCSMKSLAEVASGVADNLIARAADVMLKERRRLVLMARETPLHAGHIRNMAQATENGAIIAPPVPAFYARPQSLDEMVTQSCARVLDLFDIDLPETARWGDPEAANSIPVTGKPKKRD
ncbi:UbiX family flavin prenyltransferase [Thalassospira sp. HF15]|uniref:UbiX family flavin prenyltransferase n=1 Tax=Thalassospira sp. HF15 TaxID=2722755 RepID=UPI001430B0E4|nr:UbiX family flavin prenyltransferase [Thalassospira sp. HF15]NIY77559.1 UbiX family flavin prenyltransferase [Thalassospira sp. HF15]